MSIWGNKKIIPKFKKKLQGFLSDESGKITKEDVLKEEFVGGLGIWKSINYFYRYSLILVSRCIYFQK